MTTLLAVILTASAALSATAQTPRSDDRRQAERDRAPKQARDAALAAVIFSDAASTYENIVLLYLAGRAGAMGVTLGSVRGEVTRLRPLLNRETAAALDRYQRLMEGAEANGNRTSTAITAAEAFKTLVAATNPRMRRAPIEVSMYKYWAFRLVILASGGENLWPEVVQSAKESDRSWALLRSRVRDTNMRILLEETQRGLREAVERNDAAGVKLAARVQIASAAVLYDVFARTGQAMARSR
jgi:hypothetical protein